MCSLKNDIYLNNNFMVYLLQLHINPFSDGIWRGHPCPMDHFLVYSLIIHLNCYHMKNCKKSAFSMDTLIKLFVSEISVNFINLIKLSVYF